MFLTEVAVTVFSMPFDKPVDPKRFEGGNNFIDTHVFAKLKELQDLSLPISAPMRSSFAARFFGFVRDQLPTAEEVRSFTADPDRDKRSKLVKICPACGPEFNDYWALQLGDLFQNRKERDHDVRGAKSVRQFHEWLRKQVAANRPWDEIARGVLTATGESSTNPAVGYFIVTVRRTETGRDVGSSGIRRPGITRHTNRLCPLPQSPARTLYTRRLLPLCRLLQPHQTGT